jgi:hypothetical protein
MTDSEAFLSKKHTGMAGKGRVLAKITGFAGMAGGQASGSVLS